MFTSLSSFGIFFFAGLFLVVLGFIFEDKLIEFENRIFARITKKETVNSTEPTFTVSGRKNSSCRRFYDEYVA